MSLVSQLVLIEKYGLRMSLKQVAEVLGISVSAIYNQTSAGTFPIPTYLDGRRYADARDVAEYLDRCRDKAKEENAT